MKNRLLTLAVAFSITLTVAGTFFAIRRSDHRERRDIATYIDGEWLVGEYRGCILIPPDSQQLYCGVNAKGAWAKVLSEKEHLHTMQVSYHGDQKAVFWRCQKASTDLHCEDAHIKTEITP